MCSVQEEGACAPEMSAPVDIRSCKCMKCGDKASVVIRSANDPFCRSCFLSYCTHKFRSAFGKNKKLFCDGERTLVAFSGGSASTALLHLTQQGLGEKAKKKLRFIPMLCFIDEGAALGHSFDHRLSHCEKVMSMIQTSGLPGHSVALEQVLANGQKALKYYSKDNLRGSITSEDTEVMKSLFNSPQSVTAKEDLLRTLKHRLLVKMAAEHGFKKVILGDTATRLSVCLLSNIAQGRGASISLDVGFTDERYSDVTFVRPLREFTSKEIAMYNVFNSLHPTVLESFTTMSEDKSSIDRLTESFVNGLQANFPSTVYTIMRTGEKVEVNEESVSSKEKGSCCLCQAPQDTDMPQSSALNSTLHSESLTRGSGDSSDSGCWRTGDPSLSTNSPGHGDNSSPQHPERIHKIGGGTCQYRNSSPSRRDILNALCYGCRLTVKEMSDTDKLPLNVLQDVGSNVSRKRMFAMMKDCLIEEEADSGHLASTAQ